MNELSCRKRVLRASWKMILVLAGIILLNSGCTRSAKKAQQSRSELSSISVAVNTGGPIVLTTRSAEFQILPSGYLQASLVNGGHKLSLDEPRQNGPAESDYLIQDGKELHFILDFSKAEVTEATGKIGRGKRVEIPAEVLGPSGTNLRRTLRVEAYDDFPNILFSSVAYTNGGNSDYHIDRIVEQQHRLNSHVVKDRPYDMWSFHGSSYDWGANDVAKLTSAFSQPNVMGGLVNGGYGGGIP